jgi:hypothetical protein
MLHFEASRGENDLQLCKACHERGSPPDDSGKVLLYRNNFSVIL